MAGFEQTLGNVPGLGGFLAGEQNDQQRFGGDLQNVARLQQVLGAQQQQQEMGRIRQIIQQGGAPEKVIQALVGVGPTGAQMAQHYAGALKSQQEAAIRQRVLGGGSGMNLNDPDQLDALGASGIPGMAHFTARAERLRKAALDAQALKGMQGMDTPVTRSTIPAAGDQGATDAALMAAYQKQGGGSVTAVPAGGDMGVDETRYAPTTKQGGAFASLMQSSIPAIAQQAAELQRRVDAGQITAAQADVLHGRLVQQQAASEIGAQRQDGRQEPLVAILKDGKKVLVPRSEAIGATPASEKQSVAVVPEEVSHLNGKDYIATLPVGTRNKVLALAEGRVPLTSFSLRNNERDAMIQMVQQYDPTFEAGKSPARMATYKDFTSGVAARNVTAINTAIAHLGSMADLGEKLGNGDTRAINALANAIGIQLGKEEASNFQLAKIAVGDELMRVFRQVGASQQEAEDWKRKFTENASPEQMKGVMRTGAELLKGRIDAVNDQWDRGMDTNTGYPKLLSDRSKAAMAKLGIKVGGAQADAAQYPTATGPKGEKMIYKDGKWQTP